jgi:hypothetical protein
MLTHKQNRTMSNVYSLVANATGYQNMDVTGNAIPLTNLTNSIPGPLNMNLWHTFLAPNTSAVGAGGGSVFLPPGVNTSLTSFSSTINLTAMGALLPASGEFNASAPAPGSAPANSTSTSSSSDASSMRVAGATLLGAALGVVALLA